MIVLPGAAGCVFQVHPDPSFPVTVGTAPQSMFYGVSCNGPGKYQCLAVGMQGNAYFSSDPDYLNQLYCAAAVPSTSEQTLVEEQSAFSAPYAPYTSADTPDDDILYAASFVGQMAVGYHDPSTETQSGSPCASASTLAETGPVP